MAIYILYHKNNKLGFDNQKKIIIWKMKKEIDRKNRENCLKISWEIKKFQFDIIIVNGYKKKIR